MDNKTFLILDNGRTTKIKMTHTRNLGDMGKKISCLFSALSTNNNVYIYNCLESKCYLAVIKNNRTGNFQLYEQRVISNQLNCRNWKLSSNASVQEVS